MSIVQLSGKFYHSLRRRGIIHTLKSTKKYTHNRIQIKYKRVQAPFFSKYDFYGGYNFETVNGNGCIDFDMGFFYNRIQKSANSYTCMLLYGLKNNIREVNYTGAVKEDWSKPDELDANQVNKLDTLYKFTFVRDPYERVLSAYRDKIENNNTYISEEISFGEFLQFLSEDGLHSNKHWIPQTELLVFPVEKFDYIGKLENYKADFLQISAKFNNQGNVSPIEVLNGTGGRNNHRTKSSKQIKDYYNDELIEKVNKLYDRDFSNFNYTRVESASQLQ